MALLVHCFQIELKLRMLVFCGGRKTEGPGEKPEDPEKNPRTRRKTRVARTKANNKPNLTVTPGPGIEPGQQRWKTSAPT